MKHPNKKYSGIVVMFNASEEAFNVIYQMTFPNGKIYIGQTARTLGERIREHCRHKGETDSHKNRAIRKYKTFDVHILEQCDSAFELNDREVFFISLMRDKGFQDYNVTLGGDNRENNYVSYVVLDRSFNVIKEFESGGAVKSFLGMKARPSFVGNYILQKRKYYTMHIDEYSKHTPSWFLKDAMKTRGEQIIVHINSEGHIIGEYHTQRDASRASKLSPNMICYSLKNERVLSNGTFFMYLSDFNKTKMTKEYLARRTTIKQESVAVCVGKYNLKGKLVNEYNSIKDCKEKGFVSLDRVIDTNRIYKGYIFKRL